MKQKIIADIYLKAIFEHFQKIRADYLGGLLNNPTEGAIESAILTKLDDISDYDKKTLDNFYQKKTIDRETIKEANITTSIYRKISNFLKSEFPKSKIRQIETIEFIAFLIDFQPRPRREFYKASKFAKDTERNLDKNPIKPVSIAQTTGHKPENSFAIRLLIGLGIVAVSIYIFSNFGSIYKKSDKTNPNIEINIDNFNAGKNYYFFYDQNGKVTFVEKADRSKYVHQDLKPVTIKAFNAFFFEQGVDTTAQEIKILKANYFNESANLITDKEIQKIEKKTLTNNVSDDGAYVNDHELKSDSEIIASKPKLSFVYSDEDNLNEDIAAILQKEMNKKYSISLDSGYDAEYKCNIFTSYSYTPSKMFENKQVCHLNVKYEILKINDNTLIDSYNQEFKAIGFSEQSAQENAVGKFQKMYLKNE